MALKNIEVVDSGLKIAFFPKGSDKGVAFPLNAKESKAVRKHVAEYVASDSRDLPYDERLKANKRIGLKRSNGMLKGIQSILDGAKARAKDAASATQESAAPAPAPVASGSGNSRRSNSRRNGSAPRQRTKSDLTKMTKADLIALVSEAGLVK